MTNTRPAPDQLWTLPEVWAYARWSKSTYHRINRKAKFRNYGSPSRVLLDAQEVKDFVANREFDYWSEAAE